MAWQIEFARDAERELRRLDPPIARRILAFLNQRLSSHENPRALGEALKGRLATFWKYRVGDYRIIANIEDKALLILVVRIGNRRDVYR